MKLSIGVLMDPISTINPKKDSTWAMLQEARRRGHRLSYLTQSDLAVRDGQSKGHAKALIVRENLTDWYTLGEAQWQALSTFDVLLPRKDPPFDAAFLHDTLILDLAERAGTLVVNRPQGLRDANEKLCAQWFPQCSPPTLVARDPAALREFVREVGDAVLKPLDGMGGRGIFKTWGDDPNLNVILETLTDEGRQMAMAQRFVPEASLGDKRILLINGEPIPYALARIPQGTDFRGNMARGGKAVGQPLSERDRWICAEVGPELRQRGLLFAGLDVIGDFLTEINVTSPTGIRELDAQFGINIAATLFDCIEGLRQ